MSLITLDEVKAILRIDDTTDYDATLIELIPLVTNEVVYSLCQNRFVNKKITIRNSTFTFSNSANTIVDSLSQFVASKFPTGAGDIVVGGSLSNDGLYEVATVSASTIMLDLKTMRKPLVDEAEGELIEIKYVQFPRDLKLPTANWIWYLLNSAKNAGVKSESVLSYSATFINDMPNDVKKQFNRYRKLKFY